MTMTTEANAVVIATAVTATGALTAANWNYLTVPFIGVPVTVFMMAAAGALMSNAYVNKQYDRKKLYFYAITNTFLGATSVAYLPLALGWGWAKPEVQAPLAFGLAFVAQFLIPATLEAVPELVRKLFRLGKKEETKDETTP